MPTESVKVALRSPEGEVETLWADATEDGYYVLDNMPWYAYHVSLGDTIEARPDADGYLEMTRVVRKSGNRTIRVLLELSEAGREWTWESKELVAGIRARGCEIENMNNALVAVTIPPEVDLLALGDYVDAAGFRFEYADPTFEDLFPDEAREPRAPEA